MIHLPSIIRTVDSEERTVSWRMSCGRHLGMLRQEAEHARDELYDQVDWLCTDDVSVDDGRLGWAEYSLMLTCVVVWIAVVSFLFIVPNL